MDKFNDVLATLAKLPPACGSTHPTNNKPILIRRGVAGYFPLPGGDPDAFNARHGVTPAQRLAMEIGSQFGWEVPGADPDSHADLFPAAAAALAATRPTEAELLAALLDLRNAASMLVNRLGWPDSERFVDRTVASVNAATALIARAEG